MDDRTRRQKMQAMASQSDVSPNEAAIAQRWLDEHPVQHLTRDKILADEDENVTVKTVRFWSDRLGGWVVVDAHDYDVSYSAAGAGTSTRGYAHVNFAVSDLFESLMRDQQGDD